MALTYRSLLERLQAMTPERLDDTVTVYAADEFAPVSRFVANPVGEENGEDDRIDPGHFFLHTDT